jgi:hypothetical protein
VKAAMAGLVVAAVGCSSAAAPQSNAIADRFSPNSATVFVTNSTSMQLDVRGYPNFQPPIPQPLGGVLHLGSVAARASACFQIPDTLFMFGLNVSTGQHDTLVWTSAERLTLTGIDPTTILESGGQTADFVPSSSVGWSVTLPDTGVGPAAAAACAP